MGTTFPRSASPLPTHRRCQLNPKSRKTTSKGCSNASDLKLRTTGSRLASDSSGVYKGAGSMLKLRGLVATMQELGVIRLRMDGENILEVELAPPAGADASYPPSARVGRVGPPYGGAGGAKACPSAERETGLRAMQGAAPGGARSWTLQSVWEDSGIWQLAKPPSSPTSDLVSRSERRKTSGRRTSAGGS